MALDDAPFEPRLGRSRRDSAGSRGAGKVRTGKALGTDARAKLLRQIARRGGNPRTLGKGAVKKNNSRFNARGRGAGIGAAAPRTSGWSFDRGRGMHVRPRRVSVKARVVKLGGKLQAATSHVRYLQRDGVSREGEPGRFYTTFADDADGKAFVERSTLDRHQFRVIVSPEDGPAFDTLRDFTRDLMARMEEDLGTTLDWVAVDHFDTGHPHSHILIRGITEQGRILNIAGDYIAHGIRHRASQIMTQALGMQSELEVRQQLEQEVDAERLTRLDRMLIGKARDQVVDLREPAGRNSLDPDHQQLLVARARTLERMELAQRSGPLRWTLSPTMETTLHDMGMRGDIIRLMHREMTRARDGEALEVNQYLVHDSSVPGKALPQPVIGKVIAAGSADDHHERRYLILDGVDGKSHYVDIGTSSEKTPLGATIRLSPQVAEAKASDRTIAAIAREYGGRYSAQIHQDHDSHASTDYVEAHVRRLEALRRATGKPERGADGIWTIGADHVERASAYERGRQQAQPVRIELLSSSPMNDLARVNAATWLDRELVAEEPTRIGVTGHGKEVRAALALRRQWLVEEQLATLEGDQLVCRRNLLRLLAQRDVRAAGEALTKEVALPFAEAGTGERIEGTIRRRVDLRSGSFALVERALNFTLVPWREGLERRIGSSVSGLMRENGGISWTPGRSRSGPQIE
ncbi:DUF3363 domain-containing protein [Sphingobium yanoikuyae]|uniref:DUF3363 domain-containing protein n=8 Tax=Sphingobium yanoikuyae TaxID=13690 RepID=A0A3G2V3G8_SPHYA|nr:DUF3363 domain-containing protein [Sphingobium yanoikuyae]AYO79249.1 DUF3363 domain-containing protein [Sphingobium yanoikuyae]